MRAIIVVKSIRDNTHAKTTSSGVVKTQIISINALIVFISAKNKSGGIKALTIPSLGERYTSTVIANNVHQTFCIASKRKRLSTMMY